MTIEVGLKVLFEEGAEAQALLDYLEENYAFDAAEALAYYNGFIQKIIAENYR